MKLANIQPSWPHAWSILYMYWVGYCTLKKKSSHLPSFIDDVTLCKAAWVVVTLEVWFLTAAADSETDEDDEDAVVTEDDEVVITRCADGADGLFGGVWDFVPTSNIDQSNSLLINVDN